MVRLFRKATLCVSFTDCWTDRSIENPWQKACWLDIVGKDLSRVVVLANYSIPVSAIFGGGFRQSIVEIYTACIQGNRFALIHFWGPLNLLI